jgi:hypothetical protein
LTYGIGFIVGGGMAAIIFKFGPFEKLEVSGLIAAMD